NSRGTATTSAAGAGRCACTPAATGCTATAGYTTAAGTAPIRPTRTRAGCTRVHDRQCRHAVRYTAGPQAGIGKRHRPEFADRQRSRWQNPQTGCARCDRAATTAAATGGNHFSTEYATGIGSGTERLRQRLVRKHRTGPFRAAWYHPEGEQNSPDHRGEDQGVVADLGTADPGARGGRHADRQVAATG